MPSSPIAEGPPFEVRRAPGAPRRAHDRSRAVQTKSADRTLASRVHRAAQWACQAALREIVGPIIEAVLPAACPGCGASLPGVNRAGICRRCWDSVETVSSPLCPRCGLSLESLHPRGESADRLCGRCLVDPPVFDGARCALVYEGAVRAMLHLLKYEHRRDLARTLSRSIRAALPASERFDIAVPVPAHWTRRWKRGYNQAALLGRALAADMGIPFFAHRLVKRRWTNDQSALPADARRKNVAGAFTVRVRGRDVRRSPFGGSSVLLVDDVLTTGATAEACARALKQAGAARVFVAAVARTPLGGTDAKRVVLTTAVQRSGSDR